MPYWDWTLSQRSAFYLLLKDVAARVRFGATSEKAVRKKALREQARLSWHAAADEPTDPRVVEAWGECLAWMQREVDLCKRHAIPVVLLATPVDFQFVDESRTFAQRRLREFAARNDVVYVDLLAVLRERAAAELREGEPAPAGTAARDLAAQHPEAWRAVWRRYFLDNDHPTPAGHELVAEVLAPLFDLARPHPVAPAMAVMD